VETALHLERNSPISFQPGSIRFVDAAAAISS
jgi:hypothetical protein